MSLALGAGLVVLLVLAGWWPMRRWAAAWAGPTWLGRLSFATALGAALTGFVQLLVVVVVGQPATIFVPLLLAAVSLAGSGVDRARGRRPAAPGERPQLGRLLALVLLVVAVVGTAAAVGLPFRSDGSKFWAPKARELGVVSAREAPSLHDADRLGFHRDYPLLVPVLLAPAFGLGPPDGAAGPKLVLHALQLALLGVLVTLLARRGERGVLLAIAFVSMPLLTATEVRESSVAGGFVDAALALWLLLLVDAVDRLRHGAGYRADVAFAALAGTALVATKLEGLVWLGVVAGAWLVAGPQRRAWPLVVGLALLASVPTLWLRSAVVADAAIVDPGLLTDVDNLVARGVPLLLGLGGSLLDVTSFGLLPLLLILWGARRLDRFGALLVLGLLAALLAVYGASTMHLGRHLYTSLHRLLFQWLPALTLLVATPLARSDGRVRDG